MIQMLKEESTKEWRSQPSTSHKDKDISINQEARIITNALPKEEVEQSAKKINLQEDVNETRRKKIQLAKSIKWKQDAIFNMLVGLSFWHDRLAMLKWTNTTKEALENRQRLIEITVKYSSEMKISKCYPHKRMLQTNPQKQAHFFRPKQNQKRVISKCNKCDKAITKSANISRMMSDPFRSRINKRKVDHINRRQLCVRPIKVWRARGREKPSERSQTGRTF